MTFTLRGITVNAGRTNTYPSTYFQACATAYSVGRGAHDGVAFSNTKYLEEKLDWTRIAIEPLPEVFAQLTRNRSCVCVNGCVSGTAGTAHFRRIRGIPKCWVGSWIDMIQNILARIDAEVASAWRPD